MHRRIVVAGGSLASLRALETLRSSGYDGELVLVSEEPVAPYDRPPLSKDVLVGARAADATAFRTDEQLAALGVRLRLGVRATGLNVRDKVLRSTDGEQAYDGLLIATGCRARRLAIPGSGLDGVHVLRTVGDAASIRRAFLQRPRVAVIGGGFIGGEVASAARALGLDVVMLEASRRPLQAFGAPFADHYVELHRSHGVDVRLGTTAVALEGDGHVEAVRLSHGRHVAADLVVVGVGTEPEVDWLLGAGLELHSGLRCDARLWAGAPDVYAAGDIVRWPNVRFDATMRVEHWTNASEQGVFAARNLLAGSRARAYASVPYFWSDQHGRCLQFAGDLSEPPDRMWFGRGRDDDGRVLVLYGRRDQLVAVAAVDATEAFTRLRARLTRTVVWSSLDDDRRALEGEFAPRGRLMAFASR